MATTVTISAQVMARHRPEVLGYLIRRAWDRDTAEDLCQETFVRALESVDRIRDAGALRGYLLRIAHNLLINHARRPRPVVSENELGDAVDMNRLPETRQHSPAEQAEYAELATRLDEELARLTADQRSAFEMGVLQRQPYAEIARQLGWSREKVKTNVYRARQQLMTRLARYYGSDGRKGT